MSWWGAYALVILALPVVLVIWWVVAEGLRARRRVRIGTQQGGDPWHANAIVARVRQERAEEQAAEAPTELLPVVRLDDEPTQPIWPGELPMRRPHPVPRRLSPYPRTSPERPNLEVMQRVAEGLHRISDESPEHERHPRSDA